jgi:four helix bundle protein
LREVAKKLREVARGYMRHAPYEKLKFYQQLCEIRRTIYQMTEKYAKSHIKLVSQMRDAARSAKQNVREGYRKGTIGEFIHSIKISQGSLEELTGDVQDCIEDGLFEGQESNDLETLLSSADFLMARYLKSLYKIKEEGTWKSSIAPSKQRSLSQPPVTSRNLSQPL